MVDVIICSEKDAAESVFHFLLEKLKNVYYNPTADVIDNYLYLSDIKPVVLKNMVSEAPTETVEGVKVPSLEMILVETIRAFVSFSSDSRKFMLKHRLLQVSQESPGLWPPLLKGGKILMEFDGI